jgi:hypothetical protein
MGATTPTRETKPKSRIAGRVLDGAGRPVTGVVLRIVEGGPFDDFVDGPTLQEKSEGTSREVTSGDGGRFETSPFEVGGSRSIVSATPAWFVSPAAMASPGQSDVVVTVLPGLRLEGRVVDSASRSPVEAEVRLGLVTRTYDGPPGTTTFTSRSVVSQTVGGRFLFAWRAGPEHAERGSDVTVVVQPSGADHAAPDRRRVKIERDANSADVEISVERLGAGVLEVVATTPDGRPFRGSVIVELRDPGSGTSTGSRTVGEAAPGRFRLEVPAERAWTVRVEPAAPRDVPVAYAPLREAAVRVGAGQTASVAFVLPGLGRLRVRAPPGRLEFRVEPPGDNPRRVRTAHQASEAPTDGLVTWVSEGRWKVTRAEKDGQEAVREVDVRADEETTVDFR